MNDEKCFCNKTCRIIENYRSIINRKQQVISSWKIYDNNGKITFIQGRKIRKNTDALIMQSKYIYLINPWYKYMNINRDLLSMIKQINCNKLFEVILIECDCTTNSHSYELGIIQCPCLEQLNTYCTYCRFIFQVKDHSYTSLSNRLLFKNISQQTTSSFSLDNVNKKMYLDDYFSSRLGPCKHQRTVQIQIETKSIPTTKNEYEMNRLQTQNVISTAQLTYSNDLETKPSALFKNDTNKQYSLHSNQEDFSSIHSISLPLVILQNKLLKTTSKIFHSTPLLSSSQDQIESNQIKLNLLRKYKTQGTQTKLFAILLPNSPFNDMKQAKLVVQTLINVTRICQVNTLSYLIKTSESQIEIQHSLENMFTKKKIVHSLSMSSLDTRKLNVPMIEFKEKSMFIPSTVKCRNTCDDIDFDESDNRMIHFSNDNMNLPVSSYNQESQQKYLPTPTSNSEHSEMQLRIDRKRFNESHIQMIKHYNNNSNARLQWYQRNSSLRLTDHVQYDHISKLSRSNSKRYFHRNSYGKRRRLHNKKCIYIFCQRLRRRKRTNKSQFHYNESSSSSHIIPTHLNNHDNNELLTNENKSVRSFKQRQDSVIDVNLTNTDTTCQYKANDHIIIVRASKYSTACIQLQNLVNNQDTFLEELIDSQIRLTSHQDYRSICILIDDHKQSEQYRLSFLNYIYTNLSNSLKKIYENNSLELTCMNLAFFNNSLCDLVKMQRLRLIDTGRKIYLLPSCEISLRTSNDINLAINRLSTNMSYAHQIFIINFYSKQSSLSGSFLFLQLSPICSIRSKGLLTNLNSTTYSVLNLIRQLTNGQLFNHNRAKRYLLNDNSLNRLLKSYLFSPQQIMTVLTIKSKV